MMPSLIFILPLSIGILLLVRSMIDAVIYHRNHQKRPCVNELSAKEINLSQEKK